MHDIEEGCPVQADHLSCGICQVLLDESLTIRYANGAYYHLFGYTAESAESAGFTSLSFITYPPGWTTVKETIQNALSSHQYSFQLETRGVSRQGQVLTVVLCCQQEQADVDSLNCAVLDITDRADTLDRLIRGAEEHQLLFKQTGRFIYRYYLDTRTAVLTPDAAEEWGLPERVENLPDSHSDYASPDTREEYFRFYHDMLAGKPQGEVVIHYRKKEVYSWYHCTFSMVYDREGKPLHALVSFENINEQREREMAYKKWSQYYQEQLKNAVAYYECSLKGDYLEHIGEDAAQQLPDHLFRSYDGALDYLLRNVIYPDDRQAYGAFFARSSLLEQFDQGTRECSLECRRLDEGGHPYWTQATVQLLPDPYSDDIKAFILVKNIDQEKRRHLLLQERSTRDSLTGVFNRGTLLEQVEALLKNSGPQDQHTLVMVDIDHFKELNDRMGHQFGDYVLTSTAASLRSVLRSDDLIGRLGGDEFALLLKNLPPEPFQPHDIGVHTDQQAVLHRVSRALSCSFEDGIRTTGSLGAAVYPRDGVSFDELYNHADIALYEAKRQGRDRCLLYQPTMRKGGRGARDGVPPPCPLLGSSNARSSIPCLQRQGDCACYRTLLELSGSLVLEYGPEGLRYMTPSACRFSFYHTIKEITGRLLPSRADIHPGDWEQAEAFEKQIDDGASQALADLRLRLVNGQYRCCHLTLAVLRGPAGDIQQSMLSLRD
ncbi:MAG: diguanylate cyclase [Clostridiales bacterium]|nr:diguanylate cyclase [Lachnospiraceae bacterium]MCI9414834.1 diguanylate cyclase [Clostridiales bacterium]